MTARLTAIVLAWAVAAMVSCSLYGEAPKDVDGPDRDGATEDAVVSDAQAAADTGGNVDGGAIDAGPCHLDKPFGTPVAVPGLNSSEEDTYARLSDDELLVVISSRRADAAAPAFYLGSRSTRSAGFGGFVPVVYQVGDTDPMLSGDGLRLYYASFNRGGEGMYDLFVSRRTARTDGFGPSTNLGAPNGSDSEFQPFVRAGGVWFASVRATPNRAIYFSLLTGDTFGTPAKVTELESTADDEQPVPSVDGSSIYFGTNRSGKQEIWYAEKSPTTKAFGGLRPVLELNDSSSNSPTWLSPDGCRLYFHSDRAGSLDIYVAEKPVN
jgi:hypothetical protein